MFIDQIGGLPTVDEIDNMLEQSFVVSFVAYTVLYNHSTSCIFVLSIDGKIDGENLEFMQSRIMKSLYKEKRLKMRLCLVDLIVRRIAFIIQM